MGTSFSQILSTVSPTAPVNVEQGFDPTAGGNFLTAFDGNRESVGISFKAASNYDLTGVSVQLGGSDGTDGTTFSSSSFSVSIYQTTSASETPTSGTLLETQTGAFTQTDKDGGDFLTFSLPTSSPVSVKSGDFYAFVLTAPSLSGDLTLNAVTTGDALNSDLFESAGVAGSPSFLAGTADQVVYFVNGDSDAAVPEPSVYQLLIAGVLGLLFFVRRRRSLVG